MGKLHPNKAVWLKHATAKYFMADGGSGSTNAYGEPEANKGGDLLFPVSHFSLSHRHGINDRKQILIRNKIFAIKFDTTVLSD